MPDHTQDYYRGVLLPDTRFGMDTFDPGGSSLSQQGPGVDAYTPDDTSEGYMDLHATGTSEADAGQIVQTNYPGLPQGENHGGRYTWKNAADPDTSYRGWNPYSMITGCEVFAHEYPYGAGVKYAHNPDSVTTADQYVHVVYNDVDTTSPLGHGLKVKTLNPVTETWSTVSVGGHTVAPAIVELPTGRLLISCGPGGATYYSDDRGSTWSIGAHRETSEGEVVTDMQPSWNAQSIQKRRMVYHNGYLTLVSYRISLDTGVVNPPGPVTEVDHYVSDDFGNSWTLVERIQWGEWDTVSSPGAPTGSGTFHGSCTDPELVVLDGGQVCMVYRSEPDDSAYSPPESVANSALRMSKKAAPFARFVDHPSWGSFLAAPPGYPASWSEPDTQLPIFSAGPFVLCKDPEGFITIVGRGVQFDSTGGMSSDRQATGQLWVVRYRQSDIARNTTAISPASDNRHHTSGPFTMSDMDLVPTPATQWPLLRVQGETVLGASTRRSTSCLAPYKGSLLLVTGFENEEILANPAGGTQYGDNSGSLLLVTLGGYSNYDRGTGTGWGILSGSITRSTFSYLPVELPVQLDAAVSGFSLFTAATVDRALTEEGLHVDAPGGARYRMTHTNTTAIHARVRVNGPAGGGADVTTNYIRISVGGVELRLGDTEAQVWDMTVPASPNSLSTKVTFPAAGFRDWYVTYYTNDSGNLKAWVMYKDPGSSIWTRVDTLGAGTTLTTTPGTSASAANESWSGGSLGGSANSSHWKLINFHDGGARFWSSADYHPAEMQGRCFSTKPLYLTDGWKMASRGSAAFMGDQWSSVTRYEHPISAIDPAVAPSPRVQWRSIDTTTEQKIVWNFPGSVISRPLATAWGIHLSGINFKTAHFEGWNGAAWVTLATLDAEADFTSLEQTRDGNICRPTPSGSYSAERYVQLDELVGCYAVFPGAPDQVRTIAANSEGGWYRTGAAMPPKTAEIRVKGSLGPLPASGTFHIREDSVTAIVYDQITSYAKYRLRIPANQETAQGDYRIGACVVGEVLFFGQDYSWGRVQAIEPNQEILTARSGDRLVETLGPPRRRVELSWIEGWDSSETSGDSPRGWTHLTAGSALPVGVRQDPTVIAGMLRRIDGAKNPLVYLPRIVPGKAASPGTVRNILGKSRQMYGRLVGGVTTNSIIGDEDSSEITAINAIVIEEEL